MAFDIKTAQPTQSGFDINTAQPEKVAYKYDISDLPWYEKALIGIGRGGMDAYQGVKQIGQRGANLISQAVSDYDVYDTEKLDNKIKSENEQFNRDFDGDWWAKGGRIGGNIVATAPLGAAAGGAKLAQGANATKNAVMAVNTSRLANAGRLAAQGAKVGAVESGVLATEGDNFLKDKAMQVGLGAAFGGAVGGGVGALKGGKELLKDGVSNTVYNGINKGSNNKILKAFIGDSSEKIKNQELIKRTGAILTPAEKSGSKLAEGLESLAEQSLITADEVLEGATIKGLDSVKKYALKQADILSKRKMTVSELGRNLQGLTHKMTNELAKRRSHMGRKLYGEVDNFANGQKVVSLDNTYKAIENITENHRLALSGDSVKIINQANKLKSRLEEIATAGQKRAVGSVTSISPSKNISAKQALQALQNFTDTSTNLFDDIGRGLDKRLKKQMSEAIMSDLDSVASKGGSLGEMVGRANTAWRKGSQEIDAMQASIFGKVAGKNISSEINGFINNTIPPEKVVDTFRRSKPSEVKAAMKYMEEFSPQSANDFKANYIRFAVDEAMINANTAGAQNIFNPTQLLNSLGVKGGKAGLEGINRLKAIFGTTKQGNQFINDVVQLARIKASAFGRNFSGTATQNEANRLLSSIGQFATGFMNYGKTAIGTVGNIAGIKAVAKNMVKNTDNFTKTVNPFNRLQTNSSAFITPIINGVTEDGWKK